MTGKHEGEMAVPGNEDARLVAHRDEDAEPIPDPGMGSHEPRPTDVDKAAEKRAERQVAAMFTIAAICSVLFCVAYFTVDMEQTFLGLGAQNLALGLALGLALLLIGIGAIQWARKLMNDHEIIEERHPVPSSAEDRTTSLAAIDTGITDSGIGRRPLIRNSLIGAVAMLGLPVVVALRDLGPLPKQMLEKTVWRKGMRVVQDVDGAPMRPDDVKLGQLVNAEPAIFYAETDEGEPIYEGVRLHNAKAKAAVVVVRIEPDEITPLPERENWGVDGILCYSKICTHVGCPISLYEQQTHHMLCPCHQSTFDLADNAKVIFGPAARPLPQLPLGLDDEGYLIAMSDFTEPVGPSYWERNDYSNG